MSQITLPEETVEKLERAASHQGIDPTDLLVKLVEEYLAENLLDQSIPPTNNRQSKIEAEQRHYEAQHSALLDTYKDQYIAMHEGCVVDHDFNRVTLSRRIRNRYGSTPVLITQVRDEPRLTIRVRSPRMIKAVE